MAWLWQGEGCLLIISVDRGDHTQSPPTPPGGAFSCEAQMEVLALHLAFQELSSGGGGPGAAQLA